MKMEVSSAVHNIAPVWNTDSKILILGSFPSVKSREMQFFYSYKYNRFWQVVSAVTGEVCPQSIAEKKAFLLRTHIALWDVIASCDIAGSSDSSITNVRVNDVSKITSSAPIAAVFANGAKSGSLYKKYLEKETGMPAVVLPSTSPANAAYSLERLVKAWRVILPYLHGF